MVTREKVLAGLFRFRIALNLRFLLVDIYLGFNAYNVPYSTIVMEVCNMDTIRHAVS
jgi:hypothetical protein